MGELTEYLTNIACRYEQIWESEAYLNNIYPIKSLQNLLQLVGVILPIKKYFI